MTQTQLKQYEIVDDGGSRETIEAAGMEEALSKAEEWARDGDWPTAEKPVFISLWAWELDENGEQTGYSEGTTLVLDQDEPDCADDEEHEWASPVEIVGGIKENPGVWGNGGGVIINEVCLRCGCKRITDTWAQNPDNGQQGFTTVSYEEDGYRESLEALAEKEGERIGKRLSEMFLNELDDLLMGEFRQLAAQKAMEWTEDSELLED